MRTFQLEGFAYGLAAVALLAACAPAPTGLEWLVEARGGGAAGFRSVWLLRLCD